MPQQERVKPGDLITSDFINAILDRLDQLEADMSTATSKEMVITFPGPGVQMHMQDTLHITGKGFGVPAADVVTIDAAQQTVLPGGSDSEIIVKIDGVQGIGNGKTVSLLVTSPTGGSASTQFTLLPFVPDKPTGNLKISLSKAPPDLTMDGRLAPYLFTFRIHAETTLPDDYNLTATIDQLSWTALTVDDQLNARPTISIPKSDLPGTDQDVLVSLTIPQGAANGTVGTLTLNAASKQNPGALHNFGTILITVGSAPPAGQDKVAVQFKKALLATENQTNHKIEITKGNSAVITFDAAVQQTGQYDAQAQLTVPGDWQVVVAPTGFNALTGSLNNPSHNDVKITIKPGPSAAETALKMSVNLHTDATLKGEAVVTLKPM